MPSTNSSLIIVAVDGSESSIAALRHAVCLADRLGSTVRAVTAWQPPQFYLADLHLDGAPFEREAAQHLEAAITAAFGSTAPTAVESVVRRGRPASVLIEESAGAQMLIVGSRGHSEFASMLLGSVSLECITHAEVPVTVVRSDHG